MNLGLFYLGTHKACWLSRYAVPFFVSRRTLRSPPIEGHTHKSCANCAEYALRWRVRLLEKLWAAPEQLGLSL